MDFDILQKRGSWISYKGTQLAQGRDAAKEVLRNDPAVYAEIEAAVKQKLAEKKGELPSKGSSSGADE
jgi:recombination protein RecA